MTDKVPDEIVERLKSIWAYYVEPCLTPNEIRKVRVSGALEIVTNDELNAVRLDDPVAGIKIKTIEMEEKRTWQVYIEDDSPLLDRVDKIVGEIDK